MGQFGGRHDWLFMFSATSARSKTADFKEANASERNKTWLKLNTNLGLLLRLCIYSQVGFCNANYRLVLFLSILLPGMLWYFRSGFYKFWNGSVYLIWNKKKEQESWYKQTEQQLITIILLVPSTNFIDINYVSRFTKVCFFMWIGSYFP